MDPDFSGDEPVEPVRRRLSMFNSLHPRIDPFPLRSRPLRFRERPDPFPLRSPTFSERLGDRDPFPVRSRPLPDNDWMVDSRSPRPQRGAAQDSADGAPVLIGTGPDGTQYFAVPPQLLEPSQPLEPSQQPSRRTARDPFAMGRLNTDASRFTGGRKSPRADANRMMKAMLGF